MKFRESGIAAVILMGTGTAGVADEAAVAAGEAVFKKCKACHLYNKEKNRVGPHLVGIVGRKAGAIEGYKYSKSLKKMAEEGGLVWDDANLDKYLESPRKFIKRGKMAFAGLKKPEDRANVIAFLKDKAKTE